MEESRGWLADCLCFDDGMLGNVLSAEFVLGRWDSAKVLSVPRAFPLRGRLASLGRTEERAESTGR